MTSREGHVVVLGDFNEFEFNLPIVNLQQQASLTNLAITVPANERYSYISMVTLKPPITFLSQKAWPAMRNCNTFTSIASSWRLPNVPATTTPWWHPLILVDTIVDALFVAGGCRIKDTVRDVYGRIEYTGQDSMKVIKVYRHHIVFINSCLRRPERPLLFQLDDSARRDKLVHLFGRRQANVRDLGLVLS